MKRVSFNVAKAIKEAGYPQGQEEYAYRSNGDIYIFENMFEHIPDYCCDAPTYMEVWLWLWREKKIKVSLELSCRTLTSINADYWIGDIDAVFKDPEEAIIAAIEYLVTNDLIK